MPNLTPEESKQSLEIQKPIEATLPAAPQDEAMNMMAVVARAAADPQCDPAKMRELLNMKLEMDAIHAKQEFTAAFAMMQNEMPVITERGEITNKSGGVQSKYARFEDINEAVKPVLQKHGFAISFRTSYEESNLLVTGVLSHKAGHSEETTIRLPIDSSGNKNAVQGVGSSVSYGKRYTMAALLNITTRGEDDDGHAANPAPVKTITDAQSQAIVNGLGKDQERMQKFCEAYGLGQINELPSDRFDRAMAQIKKSNDKRADDDCPIGR
jgi:hypothetical protein